MARTPFKLKSSPTKGKLDDFFKGLGRKGTEARLTEQVQENQGMTNFEKIQADKAAERKSGGKSKFQRAGDEKKANKAATAAGDAANAADKKAREEQLYLPTVEVDGNKIDYSKAKGKYHAFSGKKGDKYKYRSGEGGYEFQRPGSDVWETPKTRAGARAIHDLFIQGQDHQITDAEMNPIQKKSPTKKSGFKMKSSPVKIYNKAGKRRKTINTK
jgi:hypothetical protein